MFSQLILLTDRSICRTRSGLNPNSPKHRPLFKESDCENRKANNYSLKSESNHLDRINRKKQRNFTDFNPFGERDGILQFDDYPSSSAHRTSAQSGPLITSHHSSKPPSGQLSKSVNKLFASSSFQTPATNPAMYLEDDSAFQANSSDDHFLRRNVDRSDHSSGDLPADRPGPSKDFSRPARW